MKRFLLICSLLVPVASLAQLDSLVIVIDPGHGGHESDDRHLIPDPGIDFWESESNYYKARHLQKLLGVYVDTVILTREDNSDVAGDPLLSARYTLANNVGADWFHSIHSNALDGTRNFTIVLLKEDIPTREPAFPEAVLMSSNVYNQIRSHIRTGTSIGNIPGYPGVYKDYTFYGGPGSGFNLGVLVGLTMPGELSEGSFHDYFPETRRLMNDAYRKMEAYALMKAFLQYYSAPADTFGIIAGIQTNAETLKPQNGTVVRLLPDNRTYTGDAFNNGFYMFDSLTTGPHTIVFDTPGFINDSVEVVVGTGGIHFVDRTLSYSFPAVVGTTPLDGDTSIGVNAPFMIRYGYPMDTASVRRAFSISPPVGTTLGWSSDLKLLTVAFNPALEYFTSYTVMIDSAAKGTNGYKVDIDGDEIGGDTLIVSFRTESALQAAAPVAFGQVRKSDTVGTALVIRNRASYDIILQNISNSKSEFWITPTLPDTIAAGDSASIELFFSPASFGFFSDTIRVDSDGGAIAVLLSGSSPAPNLLPSHTFFGYGTVTTDTSKVRPFWLRTSSINGVRVDSIYTKTAAFLYSPPQSFPLTLGLTDTVFLTVTFFPQAVGAANDTLFVINNSSVNPLKVPLSGNGIINSIEEVPGRIDHFALFQNYPNPFNPETVISYQLAVGSYARLTVFDVLGREVAVLVQEEQEAGRYNVTWNALTAPSGIYFYTLITPQYRASGKMVLIR